MINTVFYGCGVYSKRHPRLHLCSAHRQRTCFNWHSDTRPVYFLLRFFIGIDDELAYTSVGDTVSHNYVLAMPPSIVIQYRKVNKMVLLLHGLFAVL